MAAALTIRENLAGDYYNLPTIGSTWRWTDFDTSDFLLVVSAENYGADGFQPFDQLSVDGNNFQEVLYGRASELLGGRVLTRSVKMFKQSYVSIPIDDVLHQLQTKLDQFCSYETGWDGYDGKPLSDESSKNAFLVLQKVRDLNLDLPHLVPSGDGTLQLEWHYSGNLIEIVVSEKSEIDILTDIGDKLETFSKPNSDLTWFADALSRIRNLTTK